MEGSKTNQYTFGPEEKEILQKISTIEASVEQNMQKKNIQEELIKTKYYSEFAIETKKGPVILSNVFITAEKDKEGNISYHFRWIKENEDGEQVIEENITIDKDGKVYAIEGLREYLEDENIEIEDLMAENDSEKGRLKGISEKEEPDEKQEELEDEEQEEPKTKNISKDLKEQGIDLKITKYRKIKDSHVSERMPEVFQDGIENGIAFSNKLNRYVIISKVNGRYQLNENAEPARMTWKTIISISPDGEKIERKVPHALMQIPGNSEKEIAVTLDEYGTPSIETVNVLPCQERVAKPVREENEGIEGELSGEMRREFETEGKQYEHELAHKLEDIEQAERDSNKTVDYERTPDDYIPNTGMTWRELMNDTGESFPELIARYTRETEERGLSSEEAVNRIEEDYGNVNRERHY